MQTPGNASPGNQSPLNASPSQPVDPAAVTFAEEIGLVIVSVKPDKTADYEAVIRALQDALKSHDRTIARVGAIVARLQSGGR